jgi:Na+/alanine symporter
VSEVFDRVLAATLRSVRLRLQHQGHVVQVHGEVFTAAWSLVEDMAAVLGVAPQAVIDAIEEGVTRGMFRIWRDDDTGQVVAVWTAPE